MWLSSNFLGGKLWEEKERPVSEPLQHVALCSAWYPPLSLLLHADTEQADGLSSSSVLCMEAASSVRLLAAVELEEEAVAVGNAAERRKRVV